MRPPYPEAHDLHGDDGGRNICCHSPWEIPVFCAFDQLFETSPSAGLGDFTFVTCEEPRTKAQLLRQIPFTGSRFYHKSSVCWGLTHGILKWDQCGQGIRGSGNVPAHYLREALTSLEQAWRMTSDASLAKKAVNSYLGLVASDRHATFVEKTYLAADSLPRFHGERRLHYYDCGLVSVGHRVDLVTARSHRPFHQAILDQESLLVAQCRMELAKLQIPPRAIRQVRVDSLLLQCGTRKHKEVCAKIESLTWGDLWHRAPILEALGVEMPWPTGCEERVFRAEIIEATSKTLLDHDPPLPTSGGTLSPPMRAWSFLDEEAARRAVLEQSQGLMISGIAGCGKTFFAKKVVAGLRQRNVRVAIISRCHVSARLFEAGQTADRFVLAQLPHFRDGVLIIEEASQIPHYVWAQVLPLRHLGVRFCVLGDIPNQLCAIGSSFGGNDVSTLLT